MRILRTGDVNMKTKSWKTYAFFIGLSEAVGALSALLTRRGAEAFNTAVRQPPLSPPPLVFPIVWGILYALMGTGAARVRLAGSSRGLNLFAAQLIVNFFWSLLFFNAGAYGFCVAWLVLLWVLVLLMTLAFRKADLTAAWLQVPYLIWLTFAAYLNIGVWLLNR